MARWTAKCWLGSASGYQDIEVSANTMTGAKEQLINTYGAQQILNLREVRNSSSSGSTELSSGSWMLLGVLFILFLIVEYWYIAIPLIVLAIISWLFLRDD